jgi:thiol-disulfide isomerase/thioredoxin
MQSLKVFIYSAFLITISQSDVHCRTQSTILMNDLQKIQKDIPVNDSTILDYAFRDQNGKKVRLSDFKGKYVFIDMWYSGCGFCISANNALKTVHKRLNGKNIVFLSISIDTSRAEWIASISPKVKPSKKYNWAGKYAPANGTVTLYTGGTGSNNEFVKKYVPSNSYPKLMFISPTGQIISDSPPRPDVHSGDDTEKLVSFLNRYLSRES